MVTGTATQQVQWLKVLALINSEQLSLVFFLHTLLQNFQDTESVPGQDLCGLILNIILVKFEKRWVFGWFTT